MLEADDRTVVVTGRVGAPASPLLRSGVRCAHAALDRQGDGRVDGPPPPRRPRPHRPEDPQCPLTS